MANTAVADTAGNNIANTYATKANGASEIEIDVQNEAYITTGDTINSAFDLLDSALEGKAEKQWYIDISENNDHVSDYNHYQIQESYNEIGDALNRGIEVIIRFLKDHDDNQIIWCYYSYYDDREGFYCFEGVYNQQIYSFSLFSDESLVLTTRNVNYHTHGNITSGGDITATAPTIANGDQIVINDHSASKITNGPTFDGSTTTQALSKKGTWETFYQKPSTGIPETDLASAVQTSLGKADTSVQKITSTDNAIARFDGTGGQIQNSGVTIDDSNNITVPAKIQVQGTNTTNTTRYITSDSANNIYASVGGVASLVVNNTEVRRGSSASSVNLGSSSYPWNNVYGKKFITNGGTSSQFVKGDGSLDSGSYIKNYDFIVNASATLTSNIKKRIYDRNSQDSFWAANQRFVVTHKVYNVSDDSFVRDISTDVFKGSTLSWQNGVAEGEYAILYIGMHQDPVTESGYMYTYPYGYIFLTFYAGKGPEDESVEAKAYFRDNSASWVDCTVTKNSNIVYKIDVPNRTYIAGIEIKYKGTTPATDTSRPTSVTDIVYIRNSDTFDERNIVTKYPVAQTLYGNVTAPKFITRGGTSSQFVKGDGSLDSTAYAPLASPALTGTPTAPTAASGTNTTQIATTAFVQDALSNAGAGGSEMVDVTITGTTSSASFSTNPYNAIKAVVDDGKIAVLNANVDPLSATGVLIPVYEYTYSLSGSDYTGYKGKIQNGNYEISVDVQSTSSATVTITSVGSSITVDTALSESSTNPVQNRVITAQILENEEIVATALNNLNDRVELKQDQLVSGTTIKTINNQSILGSGNITISGGGSGGEENVIEVVKVNGTALTPDANKAVNITSVPGSIITQDATHRFVSDTEKTTWNGKQNALQYYSESNPDARINVSTDNTGEGSGSHGMITLACRDEMTDQAIAMSEISMDNVSLHHEEYDFSTGTTTLSQDIYIGNNGIKLNYDTSDNQGHEVVLSTNGFTYDNKQIATTDQIPSTVTESTVSGWGFTKNAGTITGITMNGSSKGTSGVVNLGTVITSETDPVFTASAAHGITAQDIANWNAKQNSLANTQNPYTAQGTSTKVPTITTNNLGQVTTITETDIAFPTLSKGTTSGSGNAVTDISVSGHTITLTKGSTFGTYSKPSGGIPATDLATAVSQRLLPEGSGSTDDGKIVQYSYTGGGWQLVKPITIYTGSTAPSSGTGSNGDIYIQTS